MSPLEAVKKNLITPRFPQDYPLDLREDGKGQIQQVGFDVRVATISKISGMAGIYADGSKKLPTYTELSPDNNGIYRLLPGAYAIDSMESCVVPADLQARLKHRSTVNRSACFFTGSVYDPGYKGLIAGTLYVFVPMFEVQVGARIGQFYFFPADASTQYNGDYQDQKSHSTAGEKLNVKS